MGRQLKGRKLWLVLGLLFVVALAVRLPRYSEQPVMPDEVNFFQPFAYTIIADGWGWPTKYMYIHPPLFAYILALCTVFAGGSLDVLRLVSVVLGAATPIFLFLLGREMYGDREGALAALLVAFSSYHILYSRVLMLEVPVMLLTTVGLWLFARGLHRERPMLHMVAAGMTLGLAVITKWIALLYIPALLMFLVLTTRSLRGLLDRRVFVVFAVSGLVALPCVVDLWIRGVNPIYRNLGIGTPPVVRLVGMESIPIPDLAVRGLDNFLSMTTDANSEAAGALPWHDALVWIAGFVFVVTMAYGAYGWVKGKEQEALLFSLFLVFNIFVALYGKRFQYYLLWSLVPYALLASAALVRLIRLLAVPRAVPRLAGLLSLVILFMFMMSVFPVGIIAPLANGGPTFGFDQQVLAMRTDIERGEKIASTFPAVVYYYLEEFGFKPFENDLLVLPFNKKSLSPVGFVEEVDLAVLLIFRPKFIIANRYYFDELAGSKEMRLINDNYNLVSEIGEVLLLERAGV